MQEKCNMCKSFKKEEAHEWCHIPGCPHKEESKEDLAVDGEITPVDKPKSKGKKAKEEVVQEVLPEPIEQPSEPKDAEQEPSTEIQDTPSEVEEKIADESAV